MAKHSSHLLEMARKGATHRYHELKAEIAELLKAFPHLEYGSAISPAAPKAEFDRIRMAGKRKKMSAAARKAVSARMKKYWAERRKAKKHS
jgi:hypothetical protein